MTRASRSLRLVAGLFVVLVLAVGAVAILHGGSGPGRTAVTRASWVSYHDQAGWSVSYPAGFHMEVSEQERGLSIVEVTLANFAAQPGVQVRVSRYSGNVRAIPPLDRFGRFPADGVAFRLLTDDAVPPDPLHRYMTRLPLSLASFRPSILGPGIPITYNAATSETPRAGLYHGVPRSLIYPIYTDGVDYMAIVWIGRHAAPDQRTALARIVRSLTVPNPTKPTFP